MAIIKREVDVGESMNSTTSKKIEDSPHVVLVFSSKISENEFEHDYQEFSLPLVIHRVESWCGLSEVWFHPLVNSSSPSNSETKFWEQRHTVDDSKKLTPEQLEDGSIYFVCGYDDENNDSQQTQQVSSTSPETSVNVIQGTSSSNPIPLSYPVEGTTNITLSEEQNDSSVESVDEIIRQFEIITKVKTEESRFFVECGCNNLETALSTYYDSHGITSGNLMQRTPYLFNPQVTPSDFVSTSMNFRDINLQFLFGIQHQDVEKVQIMHSLTFIDFTISDSNDLNAIHHAAIAGNLNIMKIVLSNPNLKQMINLKEKNHGYSPLHYAAGFGNIKVLEALLEAGADLNITDDDGLTPLFCAAYRGQADCVKALIAHSKANNITIDPNLKYPKNHHTALHLAVTIGNVEVVKELLEIDSIDIGLTTMPDCETPLIIACSHSKFDIAELLLEKKGPEAAKINHSNAKEYSALFYATFSGNQKFVKYLVEKGANIYCSDDDGNTPLIHAIMKDRIECSLYLIEIGSDLSARGVSHRGITPAQLACSKGLSNIVEALANKGADLNATSEGQLSYDGVSFTPLINSIVEGKINCIKSLLKFKQCDVNKGTIAFKRAPIHFAVKKNNLDIVRILVEEGGCDINVQDSFGMTPIMVAKQTGAEQIFKYLIQKGADIYIRNCLGLSVINLLPEKIRCPILKFDQIQQNRNFRKEMKPKGMLSSAIVDKKEILLLKLPISNPKDALETYMDAVKIATHRPNLPNFQKIHAVSLFFGFMHIWYEDCKHQRTLESFLKNMVPFPRRLKIAVQLANLMSIMHNSGLLHRNLKAENILITENGELILSDYGLATSVNDFTERLPHVAPESIAGADKFTKESDVFSFGTVLFYLLVGVPYRRTISKVSVSASVPDDVIHIMHNCLKPDPNQRPSFSDIYNGLYSSYVENFKTRSNLVNIQSIQSMTELQNLDIDEDEDDNNDTLEKMHRIHVQFGYEDSKKIVTFSSIERDKVISTLKKKTETFLNENEMKLLGDLSKLDLSGSLDSKLVEKIFLLFKHIIENIPKSALFIAIDIYRVMMLNKDMLSYVITRDDTTLQLIIDGLKKDQENWKTIYTGCKVLCNILNDKDGQYYLLKKHHATILEFISTFLTSTSFQDNDYKIKHSITCLASNFSMFIHLNGADPLNQKLMLSLMYFMKKKKEMIDESIGLYLSLTLFRLLTTGVKEVLSIAENKSEEDFLGVKQKIPLALYHALVAFTKLNPQ